METCAKTVECLPCDHLSLPDPFLVPAHRRGVAPVGADPDRPWRSAAALEARAVTVTVVIEGLRLLAPRDAFVFDEAPVRIHVSGPIEFPAEPVRVATFAVLRA